MRKVLAQRLSVFHVFLKSHIKLFRLTLHSESYIKTESIQLLVMICVEDARRSMKSILKLYISTHLSALAIANQVPGACLSKPGYSVRCVREFSYQDGEGFSNVNHTLPDMEKSTAGK